MAVIQTARTPSIAIARALRRAGLTQGRGKDFRVEGEYRNGERIATNVLTLTQPADETVAALADDIERWANQDGGWSFKVSVRYIDGKPRPWTTISNGPGERIREEPPTTREPHPNPEPATPEQTAGTVVPGGQAEPEDEVQPPAAPKASVTITHTRAEGTLLDGSRKGDGVFELVRPFGFRPFRSLGMLGIQHSRDREADTWRINRATTALRDAGYEVTIEIDESQRRSFAEAEAERLERAEGRAERFGDRAGRAASNSDARHKAALGALDGIEPGQPILPGKRGRHHRRAIERSDSHMRKSIEEHGKATHYGHRAEAAEQYEERRYDPNRTRRRLEKLRADLRWNERERQGASDTSRYDRRIEDLNEEIAYWEGIIEKARTDGVKLWEADDFAPGDFARYDRSWYQVKRVNPKTLTIAWNLRLAPKQVMTLEDATDWGSIGTFTIDYSKIAARCPEEAMRAFLADGKVPGTKSAWAASEAQPASAVREAQAAKPKEKRRSDPKVPKRVKVVSKWDATEATLTYLDGRGKPHKLYEPVTISAPDGEKFTEAASSRSLLAAVKQHLEEHGFQYQGDRWSGGSRSGLVRAIEPIPAEPAETAPAGRPEAAPSPAPEAPAVEEPPAQGPDPAPPADEPEPEEPPAPEPAPPAESPEELRLQRKQAAALGWSAGQADLVIAAAAGRLYRHAFGTLYCQDQPGTAGRAISNHRLTALVKAGFLTVGDPDATRRRPILVTVDGRRAAMVWKRWKPQPVEKNREQECERLRPLLHGEQARRLARQAQEEDAQRRARNAAFREAHQRLMAWQDLQDRLWKAWAKVNGIAYRNHRRPAGWVPTEEEIAEHRLDPAVVAELRADAENPEPKPVLPELNQRPVEELPPMAADDQTPEQLDLFAIA